MALTTRWIASVSTSDMKIKKSAILLNRYERIGRALDSVEF